MGAARTLLSAEEFDNYPFEEDKRYELDEGELIEMTRPAYQHNRVLMKLLRRVSESTSRRILIGEVAVIGELVCALSVNSAISRCQPSFWVTAEENSQDAKVIRGHSRHRCRSSFAERNSSSDPPEAEPILQSWR